MAACIPSASPSLLMIGTAFRDQLLRQALHLTRLRKLRILLLLQRSLETELALLHKAKETGVVYLPGHGDIRAGKDSLIFMKLIINYFYAFLRKNSRRGTVNLSIPHSNLLLMSMTYIEGFLCRKAEDTKISLHCKSYCITVDRFGVLHSQSLTSSTAKLTTVCGSFGDFPSGFSFIIDKL